MRLVAVLLCLISTVVCFIPPQNWENVVVSRAVDLSKSYVVEEYALQVRNIDSKPNGVYYFAVPNFMYEKISTVSVIQGKDAFKPLEYEFVEQSSDSSNGPVVNYIKIETPPVAPKSTLFLTVVLTVTNVLEPLPAKIGITEQQSLLFSSFKKCLSAYHTEKSLLKLKGISEAKELNRADGIKGDATSKQLVYEMEDIQPFESSPLSLLYRHLKPLMKINKLKRGIWVSHWGDSLQFVEDYQTTNEAAGLENGFSRADYMMNKEIITSSHAALALELEMEDGAFDVYYTDLVGNVSTSLALSDKIFIRPRFPIYGGWHYNFTLGWTNKLGNYLKKIGDDEYTVKVPLLNGIPGTSLDDVEVSVYLPEGSQVVGVESDIPPESEEVGYELSYFDLGNGHTKVTLHYSNLIDSVKQLSILVKYKYGFKEFMTKPLNVAKYVFIALLAYLALSKVDITLKAKK